MKKYFFLSLMALSLTFMSCTKTADIPGVGSSITSNGVISGKIVNYTSTAIDSIMAVGYVNSVDSFIGVNSLVVKSKVSSAGEFTLTMQTPANNQLQKIGNVGSGVVISDSTAKVMNALYFYSIKNGNETGLILKCNYTNTDTIIKAGMSESYFTYSDRAITIKGTHVTTEISSGKTYKTTEIYDLTLNKGWNEFTLKYNSYSSTSTSSTYSVSFTNSIGSDLQWRYFGSPSSKVRSNVRGQHGVVSFLH